mmetsp:Transcript_44463/g.118059  ORF Transcript_44463/g.118059 Transcript_44463/m.118059 type:complete len:327 (-) Transcript_44463:120-1100(-)
MSHAVASKYAQTDHETSERPIKVAVDASRKCVRNIRVCKVLSPEWSGLVDSLVQLAGLVQLEGQMPVNMKVVETQGRNKDSKGTLWDQERHENAIRILVEEAKLNLCLRMMNEHKSWQHPAEKRDATLSQASSTYEINRDTLEKKCTQFEDSAGFLMCRSFMHVEALQLMDIPLLIEHIAMVLLISHEKSFANENVQLRLAPKTQEVVVLHYFSSLMKHAELLNNEELLAKTRETGLCSLVTRHCIQHFDDIPGEILSAVLDGFSYLADNEDFGASWEGFFLEEADRTAFLRLESMAVSPILKENPSRKRDLRPLLDFFKVVARSQ